MSYDKLYDALYQAKAMTKDVRVTEDHLVIGRPFKSQDMQSTSG